MDAQVAEAGDFSVQSDDHQGLVEQPNCNRRVDYIIDVGHRMPHGPRAFVQRILSVLIEADSHAAKVAAAGQGLTMSLDLTLVRP